MHKDPYIFAQLVKFLDRSKFNRIVTKYEGDKYIKSYTCWNQLLTMMFGQLSNRVSYQETQFQTFLSAYADSLNAAFLASSIGKDTISTDGCEKGIKRIYQEVPEDFGLSSPYPFQHPKHSIVNQLYSSVGVLGYMGPFFAESHINHELLPVSILLRMHMNSPICWV